MADWVHSPVHDDHRSNQLDLRFPHFRDTALGVPRVYERAAIPHRMVRGVPGNTDAGSVCDPDGKQPFQEPSQPVVADQRAGGRGYRRCTAVHASREPAAVYTATSVVVGCVCASRRDLPLAGAGR